MFDSFDEMFEKKSPYRKEVLEKYRKKWENGEEVPFGIAATLKAQGMIPRSDGSYKVSDEYNTPDRVSAMKSYAARNKKPVKTTKKKDTFFDKHIAPEKKAPASHAERVEKRIHREEKKKLKKVEKPERIEKHPDFKHKGNPVDKDFEGTLKKDKHVGKKQDTIPVKKPNKKSFAGNDISKKTYDVKPGAKKKWSSKTQISESFLDFEEFSIYESLTYSGGDVARMPIIGKVTTKPIGPFESTTYDIVEIIEDERGSKYYICNFWYKNRIPQIIHEDLVEKFVKTGLSESFVTSENFPSENHYIVHVTDDQTAKKIYETNFVYNLGTALQGTAAIINSAGLEDLLTKLSTGNSPHRGYRGLFIMAFPKSEFGEMSASRRVSIDTIEDDLLEMYPRSFKDGKFMIPSKYNYGYFSNGKLHIRNDK